MRNKHITINLDDNEYNYIESLSQKMKRRIADMAYIIISDYIDLHPTEEYKNVIKEN